MPSSRTAVLTTRVSAVPGVLPPEGRSSCGFGQGLFATLKDNSKYLELAESFLTTLNEVNFIGGHPHEYDRAGQHEDPRGQQDRQAEQPGGLPLPAR